MSDTSTNPATGNDTPAAADAAKRTHTSPRLLALREVDDIIAHFTAEWEKDTDAAAKEQALLILGKLSEQVGVLKGGHPKPAPGTGSTHTARPANPYAGKRHYVGQLEDGTYVYVDTDGKAPTKANIPQCAKVYGPFRTEDGARYAVAHSDTLESRPRVF